MTADRIEEGVRLFLRESGIHPVLLDIGASGSVPAIWEPIAPESHYIGFDADLRELRNDESGPFLMSHMINAAVTPDTGQHEATFHLTRYPYCSSTLEPDIEALAPFLFVDLFRVERTVHVSAVTLEETLQKLGIERVHWFKTDSQGTDLRLFRSLPQQVREGVLAVDTEPGLIDAYAGEDLFVEMHTHLVRNGFWLSDLAVRGAVRMRETTLDGIGGLDRTSVERAVRPTPAWCEARYLRTTDSLADPAVARLDWELIWVFAMLDRQWGFALDTAHALRQCYPSDRKIDAMVELPLTCIRRASRASVLRRVLRAVVPRLLVRLARAIPLSRRRAH